MDDVCQVLTPPAGLQDTSVARFCGAAEVGRRSSARRRWPAWDLNCQFEPATCAAAPRTGETAGRTCAARLATRAARVQNREARRRNREARRKHEEARARHGEARTENAEARRPDEETRWRLRFPVQDRQRAVRIVFTNEQPDAFHPQAGLNAAGIVPRNI